MDPMIFFAAIGGFEPPSDTLRPLRRGHRAAGFAARELETRQLLAGVIAVAQEPGTMRLRQMWVRSEAAGKGRGQFLLAGVEEVFRAEGYLRITLNARLAVRGFYEKCGYTADGPEFKEVGIPHIRMTRPIEL